jgi:hypothetical protein
MAIRKSSNSGIPFGNTASRPASPSVGQPYFNGEVGRLELYSSNGWQNIVQETPGVASASGTYNESAGSGTFTISGTNFVDGVIAYAVGTNGTEYQATTTTYNSIVQITALFTGLSPDYEPYDIKVTNPSNLFGLLPDAFFINDSPVWATSSGSLGTWDGSSIQLSATDDESNTITYSVTSGALPTGLTLSSAGLISGTTTANVGTYTFTVGASDGVNTAVTRSFSIIVPASITGGTLTSDSTYYYRTFTGSGSLTTNLSLNADILTIAGGGAGGSRATDGSSQGAGGGGAGGLVWAPSYSVPSGTHTVEIGAGGAGVSGTVAGNDGLDSTVGSLLTAKGGGGGGGYSGASQTSGKNGGSGGGGGRDNSTTTSGGSSTQTSGSGFTGYGNSGGQGSISGSSLSGAGGGGGAGAAGQNAQGSNRGGVGGVGLSGSTISALTSIGAVTSTGQLSGGTYFYAGGGGAASAAPTSATASSGGLGGGGNGGYEASFASTSGTANTGGGGGADSSNGSSGGSGIVIVRYTKASVGG